MNARQDVSQEATDSAATGAEAKATGAEAAATIDAKPNATETPARDPSIGDNVRSFALAPYKPPAQYRFVLLAASVAIAAALGGLIGSVSTLGLASPKPEAADNSSRQLEAAFTRVTKEVAALKASIDASNRAATTQVSKITERFDRSEKAQTEPSQKLAALTETVAKLEKRLAAGASTDDNIVTGSIPHRAAAQAAPKDQSKPAIVEGWVLRDIYRGRALVEGRSGLYEVAPGGLLPGVGRVETITQQNGRWVVVTPKGLIVSMR